MDPLLCITFFRIARIEMLELHANVRLIWILPCHRHWQRVAGYPSRRSWPFSRTDFRRGLLELNSLLLPIDLGLGISLQLDVSARIKRNCRLLYELLVVFKHRSDRLRGSKLSISNTRLALDFWTNVPSATLLSCGSIFGAIFFTFFFFNYWMNFFDFSRLLSIERSTLR